MKIFGIGTDIVSIIRIKKSIKNKRFMSRVYNVKEISHKTKEPVNLVSRSKSEMIRKLKILLNEKKK